MFSNILFLFFFPLACWANLEIAITVDDLPRHGAISANTTRLEITKDILDILKAHGVPEAYGFVNGGKLNSSPDQMDILNLWRTNGYPIGNHGYNHKSLTKLDVATYKSEILKNDAFFENLKIPKKEYKYYRYPFLHEGNTMEKRNEIRKFLNQNNYSIAPVTIDTSDWMGNEFYAHCKDQKKLKIIASLKKTYLNNFSQKLERDLVWTKKIFGRQIKHILLLHVGEFTAQTLDETLHILQKKGFKFIRLEDALSDPLYKTDPQYLSATGESFIDQWGQVKNIGIYPLNLKDIRDYSKDCKIQ